MSEFAELEKTVEFVASGQHGSQTIRIEAIRSEAGHFFARAYVRRSVTSVGQVWAELTDLPWTKRDTADSVIEQAMSFMVEMEIISAS